MKRIIGIYGGLLVASLIAIKLLEYLHLSAAMRSEVYMLIIAVAFLVAGAYLGYKLNSRREPEKLQLQAAELSGKTKINGIDIELSQREMEVLVNIAEGYSNREIAENLFVSLNTVKTHCNNIYSKLGVNRRTQAVSKARELDLIS